MAVKRPKESQGLGSGLVAFHSFPTGRANKPVSRGFVYLSAQWVYSFLKHLFLHRFYLNIQNRSFLCSTEGCKQLAPFQIWVTLRVFCKIIFNFHHRAFDVKICMIMKPRVRINFKAMISN